MTKLLEQIQELFENADTIALSELPSRIAKQRTRFYELQAQGVKYIYQFKFWEEMKYGKTVQIQRAIKELIKLHNNRNERIAKKLESKGITSIDTSTAKIVYGDDFEKIWYTKDFKVSLRVCYAGGHNVQQLHQRVICKITENKKEVA
jgi:hypothetical protein